jgi:hypothetical protein
VNQELARSLPVWSYSISSLPLIPHLALSCRRRTVLACASHAKNMRFHYPSFRGTRYSGAGKIHAVRP